jgi:hypothetical protein
MNGPKSTIISLTTDNIIYMRVMYILNYIYEIKKLSAIRIRIFHKTHIFSQRLPFPFDFVFTSVFFRFIFVRFLSIYFCASSNYFCAVQIIFVRFNFILRVTTYCHGVTPKCFDYN